MLRYALANVPARRYAPVFLGQQTAPAAQSKQPIVPKPIVNVGIMAMGVLLSTLGYYNRKTDLGVIAMGAGSSIVGAGIVLLVLDWAGFGSNGNGT